MRIVLLLLLPLLAHWFGTTTSTSTTTTLSAGMFYYYNVASLFLVTGFSHLPLTQANNGNNATSPPGLVGATSFVWKKQLFSPASKGPTLTQVDSRLFIMTNKCEIFVVNTTQGDTLHHMMDKKINSTKVCSSGLAFSLDFSFFLQTGHLSGET